MTFAFQTPAIAPVDEVVGGVAEGFQLTSESGVFIALFKLKKESKPMKEKRSEVRQD